MKVSRGGQLEKTKRKEGERERGRESVSRARRTLKGKGARVIEEDGKRGPY